MASQLVFGSQQLPCKHLGFGIQVRLRRSVKMQKTWRYLQCALMHVAHLNNHELVTCFISHLTLESPQGTLG